MREDFSHIQPDVDAKSIQRLNDYLDLKSSFLELAIICRNYAFAKNDEATLKYLATILSRHPDIL